MWRIIDAYQELNKVVPHGQHLEGQLAPLASKQNKNGKQKSVPIVLKCGN